MSLAKEERLEIFRKRSKNTLKSWVPSAGEDPKDLTDDRDYRNAVMLAVTESKHFNKATANMWDLLREARRNLTPEISDEMKGLIEGGLVKGLKPSTFNELFSQLDGESVTTEVVEKAFQELNEEFRKVDDVLTLVDLEIKQVLKEKPESPKQKKSRKCEVI